LNYVLQQINNKPIDEVVLFYTDQDGKTEPKHRETDTIFFAKILKKLILENFPQIRKVELIKIVGKPVNPDNLFPFYNQYFFKYSCENFVDTVIISPTGGIPACNWAMLLQATKIFKEKVLVVYVPDSGKVEEVPFAKLILDDYKLETIRSMLDYFDFSGALKIMESTDVPNDPKNLARYAEARLRFDFSSAIIHLEKLEKKDELIETLLGSITKFTQDVKQANSNSTGEEWEECLDLQKQKIAELAMNSEIKWVQGEYADFLARIFRFREALQRFLFEHETHHSSEKLDGNFPDFEKYLKHDEYFQRKLERKKKLRCEPTGLVMKIYLKQLKGKTAELSKTIDIIENLEKLANLRNKSIIAHGYRPITREEIGTNYEGDIVKDLDEVIKYFNEEDRKISIDKLVNLIKREIH